jgi:hypothetical protein
VMMMIEIPEGYRAKLWPVTAADDRVLRALDQFWAGIRAQDDRVPAVLFEIGPGRETNCSAVGWDQPVAVLQLNMRRDDRNVTGREVAERLLHYAAHAIVFNPERPPGMAGRWHSTAFRDAASELGLTAVARDPDSPASGTGWSETSLGRGTISRYRPEIDALDRALAGWEPTEQPKTKRRDYNQRAAECACGRKIRVAETTLALAPIVCGRCGQPFKLSAS